MEYVESAKAHFVEEFSPRCRVCTTKVDSCDVWLLAKQGADRWVFRLRCKPCQLGGRVTLNLQITQIYDIEGLFSIDEVVFRTRKIPRTKQPKELELQEILLEVWAILHGTR
jgi:hypothetical protein